jgi:parallel beta-helix repeat protein
MHGPDLLRRADRGRAGGRLRGVMAAAAAVAVTGLVTVGPASAAPAAPCPGPLTANTTLSSDLACDLRVAAPIVLNLGGHTVTGDVFGAPSGGVPLDDVRVTNGTVVGTVNLTGSSRVRLDHVTVRNGSGFAVQLGPSSRIQFNRFLNNGTAVDEYFGGSSTISDNVFEGNGIGVLIGRRGNVRVQRNSFTGNDTGAFLQDENFSGASDNAIEGNRFSGNGVGVNLRFRCDSPATGTLPCTDAMARNTIAGNRIERSSGSGVVITGRCTAAPGADTCAGSGTTILDNRITGNGTAPPVPSGTDPVTDDGLTFVGTAASAAGVTLTGNTANRNADLGFDAAGVVDGGGNRAAGNGNPVGCVGVACS